MKEYLPEILTFFGTSGLVVVIVTKLFDIKLEKLKNVKEIETTKIVTEASLIENEGKEAVQTIVTLNHILVGEVERLTKALKECNERHEFAKPG